MSFRFAEPEMFWMLLMLPILWGGRHFLRRPRASVGYPLVSTWRRIPGGTSRNPERIPFFLRLLILVLLIAAAGRPQYGHEKEIITSKGLDIMIALDISGSMRALDFQPKNRLEAAKEVIGHFITQRKHDRIGLVLFGSQSFTLCPLTLDHDLLLEFLRMAQIGMVEEQTALGKAIATAVNRLRTPGDSTRTAPHIDTFSKNENIPHHKSKIVILVTDGVNTITSKLDPITSAKAAKALGIKIYTIGVGTNGLAPFPHPSFPGHVVRMRVELDEATLKEIARITGGQYFSARNTQALKTIFDLIDKLEKVEIKSFKYTRYNELFMYPLAAALVLIILERIVRHTIYRRFP